MDAVLRVRESQDISRFCFVCRQEAFYIVKKIEGRAKCSGRRFSEIVRSFTNKPTKPSHILCQLCVSKLEEYDEHSMKTASIHHELFHLANGSALSASHQNCRGVFGMRQLPEIKVEEQEAAGCSRNLAENSQRYVCDFADCGRVYRTADQLERHRAKHGCHRLRLENCIRIQKVDESEVMHQLVSQKDSNFERWSSSKGETGAECQKAEDESEKFVCPFCKQFFDGHEQLIVHLTENHDFVVEEEDEDDSGAD